MIPKFRAWVKPMSRMYPVIRLDLYDEDKTVYILGTSNIDIGYTPGSVVLMQSTGLYDKNGVEIFEKDVVRLKYTVYSDYEIFKVTRFRGGSWRIDNRQRGTELWLRHKDCEVVGNIYDNPELVQA